MTTVQAYQGYFQADGRFIADIPTTKLPTMRRVIVNILEDEIVKPIEVARQQKAERLKKILDDALKVENNLTDDEWGDLENIRGKTNSGMTRTVNL